tara:strand:+ start:43 stop:195 length:153 start_codon:yes stop_codon:yes gene_type:complete
MNMDDLKMGFINFSAFTMSFTNIEIGLKLTLLTVTIIYTVIKIIKISKEE